MPFPIPRWLWERVVEHGSEIGEEVPGAYSHDPMAYFTNRAMDRAEICAWALVMALLPMIYFDRFAGPVVVHRTQDEIEAFKARQVFNLSEYNPKWDDIAIGQ